MSVTEYQFVDGTRLVSVVEALIFASPDPISREHLAGIINENEPELDLGEETLGELVDHLNHRYEENGLSFRIEMVGGGYTFVTQPRYHPWLSIYQHENAYRKLSRSAIETLAIVAYRQPITKPEVDQIRGVDSGYILRQLLEKMLIKVSGRADSPGKPLLYKTTEHFLKHFGLNSVEDLPRPREIDEILKDDDMADHRRLLMERQLELDEEEASRAVEDFLEKRTEPDEPSQPNQLAGFETDGEEADEKKRTAEPDDTDEQGEVPDKRSASDQAGDSEWANERDEDAERSGDGSP